MHPLLGSCSYDSGGQSSVWQAVGGAFDSRFVEDRDTPAERSDTWTVGSVRMNYRRPREGRSRCETGVIAPTDDGRANASSVRASRGFGDEDVITSTRAVVERSARRS
ncbi:hypothetical protein EA473_02880 [Natrarchaeobius chitinivorans]|uniref:Uncharacterized protein n=1 Tax=Natrarchaeobius chitinivorans TaxID=1679083 RepID=A0A3N6MJ34_NATCH|nr:hypothetical protein EA473_02880 [Natrarchaeobius chitinivorans]